MYVAGSSLSLSVARGKESRFDRVISFLLHKKLKKRRRVETEEKYIRQQSTILIHPNIALQPLGLVAINSI